MNLGPAQLDRPEGCPFRTARHSPSHRRRLSVIDSWAAASEPGNGRTSAASAPLVYGRLVVGTSEARDDVVRPSSQHVKRDILDESRGCEDDRLVEVGWIEYRAFEPKPQIGTAGDVDRVEAGRQRRAHVVLSGKRRRRVRSFVLSARWQERKLVRAKS